MKDLRTVRYQSIASFLKAVDEGEIKAVIDDELRAKLTGLGNMMLTISALLYLFPDDFDMPFKLCHQLSWLSDPYYSSDVDDCLYYFHSTGRDDLTKSADTCVSMRVTKTKK